MNYYRLPEKLGNEVLAYLQTRPYVEVAELMPQLLALEQITMISPQQTEGGDSQNVPSQETQHQENPPSSETNESSSEQKQETSS